MLDSIRIRLAVRCDDCDTAVPVNGPLEQVKCPRCQSTIRLEGRLRWPEVLDFQNPGGSVFAWAVERQQPGQEMRGAWRPVLLSSTRCWPSCPKCAREHSPYDTWLAAKDGRDLTCTACGTISPLRPVPAFFRQEFPCAAYVVGAQVPSVPGTAPAGTRPVVMACMSCGGDLHVDGAVRLVECAYCKASNYLPDDLWLALHPAPRREEWHILFDTEQVPRGTLV